MKSEPETAIHRYVAAARVGREPRVIDRSAYEQLAQALRHELTHIGVRYEPGENAGEGG